MTEQTLEERKVEALETIARCMNLLGNILYDVRGYERNKK